MRRLGAAGFSRVLPGGTNPPELSGLAAGLAANAPMVSWPSPSTDGNLQPSANVATANWVAPAEPVNKNGTINYLIVNLPTCNRFYRLMR